MLKTISSQIALSIPEAMRGGNVPLDRRLLIDKALPALVFLSLWLDGGFYPLLLLPFLYVILLEKKDLAWLGFKKQGALPSIRSGLLVSVFLMAVYYPISRHYASLIGTRLVTLHDLFTDIAWYPLYEEVAYRGFLLTHFARFKSPNLSKRNILLNLIQSLFFLSIHRHHVTSGVALVLLPVFLLGLLNGFLFIKTRNIFGCLLSHSAVNGFALLLRYSYIR